MSKVKQKQAKRRTEIIQAAAPIIEDVPFEDISIAEICGKIGLSVGSFYHYFTKKTDLLVGLLWLIDEDLEQRVFPLLTDSDELENLRSFAHGWAEHVDTHGLEHSKLISSINPDSPDFAEQDRPAVGKLEEIISRGQEKGQIIAQREARELAEDFMLILRGVTMDWSRRDGSYDVVAKMDRHIDVVLRAFRP